MALQYVSRQSYKATVGQTEFDLSIDYLLASHIEVYANGSRVPFEFVNRSRIKLLRPCMDGDSIRIQRNTPISDQAVQFQDGAVLTAEDQNNAIKQLLFKLQEVYDLYSYNLEPAVVKLADNLGIVTDPAAIMDEVLAISIMGQQLVERLQARLSELDLTNETVLASSLRSYEVKQFLQSQLYMDGQHVRTVIKRVDQQSVDGLRATANTIALIGAETTDGYGFVLNSSSVMTQPGLTLVEDLTSMKAQTANSAALLSQEIELRTTADDATAHTLSLIGTQVANSTAFRVNEATLQVGTRGSIGVVLDGLTASVAGANAAVVTESQVRANAVSAVAQSLSSVSARVGNAEGSISGLQSVASGIDGKVNAIVGLAMNVNGYLSGYKLTNDGSTGTATFLVNRFAVVDPNGGSPIVPFEISGGALRAPLIIAGDIYANTITADKIVGGAVTTPAIATSAVSTTYATSGNYGGSVGKSSAAGSATVTNISVYCNGYPLLVQGGYSATQVTGPGEINGTANLYRDGSLISEAGAYAKTGYRYSLNFSVVDNPGAGWHTYSIVDTVGPGAAINFYTYSLSTTELKR